ncbi:MAG TPA: hypothetical protein VF620_14935 [Allosphingosinicella sp.]|jgi:hypothetical protein
MSRLAIRVESASREQCGSGEALCRTRSVGIVISSSFHPRPWRRKTNWPQSLHPGLAGTGAGELDLARLAAAAASSALARRQAKRRRAGRDVDGGAGEGAAERSQPRAERLAGRGAKGGEVDIGGERVGIRGLRRFTLPPRGPPGGVEIPADGEEEEEEEEEGGRGCERPAFA